jgi:hypothetical protein
MMNAPDRPWQMRPSSRNGGANGPDGATPTRMDPPMLSMNPQIRIVTRPSRSARPPTTTMKMPEKSAVIETAMFMTLIVMLRSAAIDGAMLRVVWEKSQKASTPRMMPRSSLSSPR